MYKNGFLKASLVSPKLSVANPKENVKEILNVLKDLKSSLAVFPELSLTSYSAQDLFYSGDLLKENHEALDILLKENSYDGIIVLGGLYELESTLFNVAYVIYKHQILGIVPKTYLPNNNEFHEKRWFSPGIKASIIYKTVPLFDREIPFGNLIFEFGEVKMGIEICEDLWAPVSPGTILALNGANLIVNVSASNDYLNKDIDRLNIVKEASRRNSCLQECRSAFFV